MKFKIAFKVHKNIINNSTHYLLTMPGIASFKSESNTLAIKTFYDSNQWRYIPSSAIINGWNNVKLEGDEDTINLTVNEYQITLFKDTYKEISGVYYSGFSGSKYLRIPKALSLVAPWDMKIVLKTGSTSRVNLLLGAQNGYMSGGFAIEFGSDNKFGMGLSYDGSSWNSWLSGTYEMQNNTKYYLKVGMDSNYNIKSYVSEDDENYTPDIEYSFGRSLYQSSDYLQLGTTGSESNRSFQGSLYYTESYCINNGTYMFNGKTDVEGTDYIVVGSLTETEYNEKSGVKYPKLKTGQLELNQSWMYIKDIEALLL